MEKIYLVTIDGHRITGFQWDKGNLTKSVLKHGITVQEAEAIFVDNAPVVADATRQEDNEPRWFALAEVPNGRVIRGVFTIRGSLIRFISVRVANKTERPIYDAVRKKHQNES